MTAAALSDLPDGRVLHVIGAGLIGTSVALAATRAGWTVTLEDRDAARATQAAALVALERAVVRGRRLVTPTPATSQPMTAAGGPMLADHERRVLTTDLAPDLVCVAVPPQEVGSALLEALGLYLDATVMDVSSVKSASQGEINPSAQDSRRLVWTHPLAGAEGSGPEAARADLFEGRTWIVCGPEGPTKTTPLGPDAASRHLVEGLVSDCGARPLSISASRHDALLAMTSHLPQLVASALASEVVAAFGSTAQPDVAGASTAEPVPSLLAGPGLLDMTRIAASPSAMWAQIAAMNRQPVRDGLRRLTERLQRLEASLEDPETTAAAVTVLVDEGRAARGLLDRKHAGATTAPGGLVPAPDWTWVRATIADVPGTLARVFAVAGELGVNIEDVRVDHAPYASQGLVSVAVRSADADRLSGRLQL